MTPGSTKGLRRLSVSGVMPRAWSPDCKAAVVYRCHCKAVHKACAAGHLLTELHQVCMHGQLAQGCLLGSRCEVT